MQYHNYERRQDPKGKNKLEFVSKIFSTKKKIKRVKTPHPKRVHHVRTYSPQHKGEKLFVFTDNEAAYQIKDSMEDEQYTDRPQYNVLFVESPLVHQQGDHFKPDVQFNSTVPGSNKINASDKAKVIEEMQKNPTYFEVVKMEDKGTDPWEAMSQVEHKVMVDKGTDAVHPTECKLLSCEKDKEKLKNQLHDKEKIVKSSLEEGGILLEDIERLKKLLSNSGKIAEIIGAKVKCKQESPADFIHLSRIFVIELGKYIVALQKQTDTELQKVKWELNSFKKEKTEKEGKLKSLERKLEAQTAKANQEEQDHVLLQSKIGKLQDAIDAGKKILKETEKSCKTKVEKLENELTAKRQSAIQLSQVLDEKSRFITQLEGKVELLQNTADAAKQQVKDIQHAYKSKIAKLESDHTEKVTDLCKNQTLINKQLSQALEQSSNYVNQMQETKKENAILATTNSSLTEKVAHLERELGKSQERCAAAERRLMRETQEVVTIQDQIDKLEAQQEEEMMSIDGDVWCQIMYQHDQWIMEDLRNNLVEKEKKLEALRSQGDCALRDFEKMQNELQQRRQQFNELKDVFLDFEKKRDTVVREQREFYSKMLLLSSRTIPRDRFFKNLIEECQTKTVRIDELEKSMRSADKTIEEAKKNNEAQLKAMQAEMKYTAGKLYEFENLIKLKEMHLQEVIKVFEQEKMLKMSAEGSLNTYKLLLEDLKKENTDIRAKLNYLEDLQKNRTNISQVTEELAKEAQKREDAEGKLKDLEKDFQDIKNQLKSKSEKGLQHTGKLKDTNKEIEHLRDKVRDMMDNMKYMERILMESQKSKESLQKDHEELYNKLRRAVRVMVESKATQESLEFKLDQRRQVIEQLQMSYANTEDQLDTLRDVLQDMRHAMDTLYSEKEELKDQLANHMHCKAEMALHQELKMLQRDKVITEEQNSREKEMLLHRLRDNEDTMKEQHKHLRAFQEQLDSLNAQLREAKTQLASERHSHTQQVLAVQADKKKLELYIQELEQRLAYETRLRMHTSDAVSSPPPRKQIFTSSDSYEQPNRDQNKYHYRK
ncbi:myosin-2 heavy chain-like isoform X2 [Homalodisca vitripennis]|nr:myosin-2 heavy chain-like isoform X2 [Homalodisca vitripennis]